jgi:GNAT superfamily N-acetyltransferase
MIVSTDQIAYLEWSNYAATALIAQVTPDLEVCLKDEIIITCSRRFPLPDATHACQLQTTSEKVDNLIEEVIDYFKTKSLPTTIYVSPACRPPDLEERLLKRGFMKLDQEAWLVFERLLNFDTPPLDPQVTVKQVTSDDIRLFVKVMMTAFEIPGDYMSDLLSLTQPSLQLSNVCHYLAWVEEQPVGTCSLVCIEGVATLGGVGVTPAYRGRKVALNLVLRAFQEAQKRGIDTIILQTVADAPLERALRIAGFKRVFTRTAYSLYE